MESGSCQTTGTTMNLWLAPLFICDKILTSILINSVYLVPVNFLI